MKTAELTGPLLDFWVAKAEGFEPEVVWTLPSRQFAWVGESLRGGSASSISHRFSQDWALGGPIIERENIQLSNHSTSHFGGTVGEWGAMTPSRAGGFGATPLIAAMRAYVASKFGEDVAD